MPDYSLNRRDMLKMGAFASAATFFNFAFNQQTARAQVQPTANSTTNTFIRLSGNENSYCPSPKARQAIVEAALSGNRYAGEEFGMK